MNHVNASSQMFPGEKVSTYINNDSSDLELTSDKNELKSC
jgi:hypothetical protein